MQNNYSYIVENIVEEQQDGVMQKFNFESEAVTLKRRLLYKCARKIALYHNGPENRTILR